MMKERNVNHQLAKDLVSNAGSNRGADKVANLRDFEAELSNKFDKNNTLAANKAILDAAADHRADDDLRSIKSEFDYGSKKKFVDILGNVSRTSQLNRLRADHKLGSGNTDSVFSYKSGKSTLSRRSNATNASKRRFASMNARGATDVLPANVIAEQEVEDE